MHDVVEATRRAGGTAVAGGLLLLSGVAAELAVPAQEPDGTVVRPALFAAYVATWAIGSAALVAALRALRRLSPPEPARGRRSGRTGFRLAIAGAALLAAFGVVALVTGLAGDRPLEASFLLFALGLLLCFVGHLLVGFTLRRSRAVGRWWAALPAAALGLLAAVAIPADPWHDLGLFAFDGAWMALGLRLLVGRPGGATVGAGTTSRRDAVPAAR